jgi:hypothetical protein
MEFNTRGLSMISYLSQKLEEIHRMHGLNQTHIHEDSAEDPPGQQCEPFRAGK